MPYLGKEPVRGQNRELDDISGSFNGGNTAFTMQVGGVNTTAGSVNQLFISVGGVMQNPGTDFTVSSSTITFTTPPANGLDFWGLIQGDAVDINTPADASVTESKLNANAPTNDYVLTADATTSGGFKWAEASGTTINNNADNRIITGSGTADTLNGEANLTFDGEQLNITHAGTTDPENQIVLQTSAVDTGGGSGIFLKTSSSTTANRYGSRIHTVRGANGASDLVFSTEITGGSALQEALKISANKNVTVTDGDLVIGTAAHGIDFSADGHASGMTNELLADYEEGTFSVEVQNGWGILNPGYAYNEGQYVKVGDMVCCTFRMQLNAGTTNGNQIYLTGLPFAALNVANKHYPMWHGYFSSAASDAENVRGYTGPNQTYVYFIKTGGSGTAVYTGTMAGTSFDCYWSCTYRTN